MGIYFSLKTKENVSQPIVSFSYGEYYYFLETIKGKTTSFRVLKFINSLGVEGIIAASEFEILSPLVRVVNSLISKKHACPGDNCDHCITFAMGKKFCELMKLAIKLQCPIEFG